MKPGFLNTLQTEEIGDVGGRAIYRLLDDLVYQRDNEHLIIIPKGFQTDFASVPRVPIVFMLYGDRAHHESTLHDYLYRTNSIPIVTRAEADNYFKEAMISRGKSWGIYYPMYLGVRLGGGSAYHKLPVGHSFF